MEEGQVGIAVKDFTAFSGEEVDSTADPGYIYHRSRRRKIAGSSSSSRVHRTGVPVRSRGLLLLASLLFLAGTCDHTPTTPVTDPPCGDPHNISCDEINSYSPTMAITPDGKIAVCWSSGVGNLCRVYEHGRWGDVDTINRYGWAPEIAAGPEGAFHAVWEEINADQSTSAVVYRMRDVQGHWHTPETLSVWSNPAKQARIDVDPTGRVHIIWGGRYRSRSPSGVWDVDESGVPVGENPSMVVDSTGRVHVIWGVGGVGSTLMYSTRIPGRGWSSRPVGRLDDPPQGLTLYQGHPLVCGLRQRSPGALDWYVLCYHFNGTSWDSILTPADYDLGMTVAVGFGDRLVLAYVQGVQAAGQPKVDPSGLFVSVYHQGTWSPPRMLDKTPFDYPFVLFPMAADRSRGGVWLPYSKEITVDTLDFPEWDVFVHFLQP